MNTNIELLVAKTGLELVDTLLEKKDGFSSTDVKITVSKALGVLRENGLYSFLIWLDYKSNGKDKENKICKKICELCLELLYKSDLFKDKIKPGNKIESTKSVINMEFTRDEIFFITEIFKKMFTYAYYRSRGGAN